MHPSSQFFRRHVFQVLGYPPIVSSWVLDTGRTISIELVSRLLNRAGARFQRTLEGQIHIFEINVEMN